MEKHIVLVGIRGSGKSTIGAVLAQKISRPFIDIDVLLLEKAGVTSMNEMNRLKGKEWTVMSERDLLSEILSSKDPVVLASGGRTFSHEFPEIKSQNRDLLRDRGIAILLSASDSTLWSRISMDTGERHAGIDSEKRRRKFEESLQYKSVYTQLADIEIQTDTKTLTAIAEEIIAELQVQHKIPLAT